MSNLQEFSDELYKIETSKSNRMFAVGLIIKVLMAAAAAVAGVSHFLEESKAPSFPHYSGIYSSLFVGICALILIVMEHNSANQIDLTRRALQKGRDMEEKLRVTGETEAEQEKNLNRATALYSAIYKMHEVVRAILNHDNVLLDKAIQLLIDTSEHELKLAAGFRMEDHWTICVYLPERDGTLRRTMLTCIADCRSIPCERMLARRWPEGVGVVGVAYATNQEVIIRDMLESDTASGIQKADLVRQHDAARYRSIAAVPVMIGSSERPWGVIVATSDRVGHFRKDGRTGIHPLEAVRTLAGMAALTVEACKSADAKPTSGVQQP